MKEKHVKCIESMLKLSNEDRLKYADARLWKIQEGLREMGYSCAKIHETILGLFRFFVSADLDCTQPENDFFTKVTGCFYTNDQFFNLTNHGRKEDYMKSVLNWMNSLSPQLFTDVFTFGAYILTADGPLKEDEIKLCEVIEEYRPD